MRVFVTGATGLLGFAIVNELISAGHQVTGLARSEASAQKLISVNAQVLRADIEDLDVLRRGAEFADGAIHTAFYHQVTHMRLATRLRVFLGGSPAGIFTRFLNAALDADRRAIETLGHALPTPNSPLVAAFGTLAMKPGKVAMEEDAYDPAAPGAARGATEATMRDLASQGVRTSTIRLPPIVHGEADRNGFAPFLIKAARKKGQSIYLGDGLNRWPSVHKIDAARLFRLALENGLAGATYHAVAEEGIPFRDIATKIGESLHLPAVSKPVTEASKHFSFLAPFIPADNPVSGTLSRQRLGWLPNQPGLLADLDQAGYFGA